MAFLDDPEEMTPEERLDEIALILAAGDLRFGKRAVELSAGPSGASRNGHTSSQRIRGRVGNRLSLWRLAA
jgi:hypothetical protein